MSKHTPGPWKVVKMEDSKDLYIVSKNKPGWNEFVIANIIFNNKADACLIAAAPDLLEACKKCLFYFKHELDFSMDGNGSSFDLKMKLEQAISKAEGDNP